jgi:hypothetical protein
MMFRFHANTFTSLTGCARQKIKAAKGMNRSTGTKFPATHHTRGLWESQNTKQRERTDTEERDTNGKKNSPKQKRERGK